MSSPGELYGAKQKHTWPRYHLSLVMLVGFVTIFLTVSTSGIAIAGGNCQKIYTKSTGLVGIESKQIQQWLAWEISPTIEDWQQERATSPLPFAYVKASTLNVEILDSNSIVGLESFLMPTKNKLPWFQHPYNQDTSVPNAMLEPADFLTAYHTASRTVVSQLGTRLVSVKLATDHPFGPHRAVQSAKVNMDKDLKYSVARSKAIERIDHEIGVDADILIQKEIAAVTDIRTGNGFLLRDLTHLQDGNFYLPGHQIPYVGKKIAKNNGLRFVEFWKKHWAEALGRYQAKLLYRYGIQLRAVNPQNFLVQLDLQHKPTGVLVWRDLAESHLVRPIAESLGLSDLVERDLKNGGWGVVNDFKLDTKNISWKFNQVSESLSDRDALRWQKAVERAFIAELKEVLEYKITNGDSPALAISAELQLGSRSILIQKILQWHRHQGRNEFRDAG